MEGAPSSAAPRESVETLKKKALFIDDDAGILDIMRYAFEGESNVTFAECHSIDEAIRAVEGASPDIIFLDNSFSDDEKDAGLKVADIVRERWHDIDMYSTTGDQGVRQEYSSRGIRHIDKHDVNSMMSIVSEKRGDPEEVKP